MTCPVHFTLVCALHTNIFAINFFTPRHNYLYTKEVQENKCLASPANSVNTEKLELRSLVVNSETPSSSSPATPLGSPGPKNYVNFWGILLAAISSFFFSLTSLIVKWLHNVDPLELATVRFIGILLPTIPILIYKKQHPFPKGKRIMLLLRSFSGATSLTLIYYAFRLMPLGDASVIIFSVPVVVTIFAKIFLKEPCSLFHYFTLFLTMFGALLIARPPFLFNESSHHYQFFGPIAAMLSTLFSATVYILLRALKNIHFSVIMVCFAIYSILQTSTMALAIGNLTWPKCGTERLLFVALGLFSFAGQMLLTIAAQLEEAGLVAIARSIDVVFAFAWQIIFFNEIPSWLSLVGAVLVTSSVVLIGLRKWLMNMPPTPFKKKCSLLFL
ncbi:solute carrier family 35 member G1 [Daktulosphaira vitifoliae]|uniref:solute carrier family 35 member G1 n=1 Tax=Daktulosphaira vitifoliae TaxID=58002 RepID=UPI0021AA947C|nr:solute carrier family 35 member G1 [Daktulosphaira vitifoliae]